MHSEVPIESTGSSARHGPALPPPLPIQLVTLPEHPCPYLPGRASQNRAFCIDRIRPSLYQNFMDRGFRRSGKLIYQPVCVQCDACRPIRVLVNQFQASKSQRRCRRKNHDLLVSESSPTPTDEKFELYRRYAIQWHGRAEADEDRESFEAFLYESPVNTIEMTYRDSGGRLLAVGICDVCAESVSSVYFYFEPSESRRGLGTFGALREIAAAARANIPYYYLGYWVAGSATMHYKTDFRPNERLDPDGVWRQ